MLKLQAARGLAKLLRFFASGGGNGGRLAVAAGGTRGPAGGRNRYPTEAVWGVGCDPWDSEAVYHLLDLKQRPVEKGLILVADCMERFDFLLQDLPDDWLRRLANSWPGPNTWLVPHQDRLPPWITGRHDSVALRVTDHPLVARLCALTGPLVSTSANPAGGPRPAAPCVCGSTSATGWTTSSAARSAAGATPA